MSDYPMIPGYDQIGFGFDVTGLLPLDPTKLVSQAKPILQVSELTDGPFKIGDQYYSAPQNLSVDTDVSFGVFKTTVGSSLESMTSQLEVDAGVTAGYKGFAAEASASYANKTHESVKSYFGWGSVTSVLASLYTNPRRTQSLMPEVKEAIGKLPKNYDAKNNFDEFRSFFATYGTHYIERFDLGGTVVFQVAEDQSLFSSESQVKTEFKAAMQGLFAGGSVHGSSSAYWSSVNESFTQDMSATVHGGDPTQLAAYLDSIAHGDNHQNAFDQWADSVQKMPAAMPGSVQLKLISSLPEVADWQNAMDQALRDYIDRQFLLAMPKYMVEHCGGTYFYPKLSMVVLNNSNFLDGILSVGENSEALRWLYVCIFDRSDLSKVSEVKIPVSDIPDEIKKYGENPEKYGMILVMLGWLGNNPRNDFIDFVEKFVNPAPGLAEWQRGNFTTLSVWPYGVYMAVGDGFKPGNGVDFYDKYEDTAWAADYKDQFTTGYVSLVEDGKFSFQSLEVHPED